MHIEKLKLFLDLYESKNFTKTAKNNFISQAALSQYINSLEQQFGTKLFDRNYSPIRSTKAGDTFYKEALLLNKQYENMKKAIENVKNEDHVTFRIGYCTLFDLQTVLPFIPTLQKKYPKIKFIPIKVQLTDIEEYLNKNLCDVVLSYETNLTLPNITRTKIIDGNYNVLVSTNHPLAKRKSVTAREAYEHPVILLSENCIGEVHDYMLNRLKEINIKPIIAKEVDDIENAIFYIISENLLGFADTKADLSLYIDSLVSIPLTEDVHKYCICASYNKDSKHPILNDFVSIISQ